MEILVFKTNIKYKKNISSIKPHLSGIENIHSWNVDLEDCDKILWIEAMNIHPSSIEKLLHNAGYYCEELKD
jgi:hypothetical protein